MTLVQGLRGRAGGSLAGPASWQETRRRIHADLLHGLQPQFRLYHSKCRTCRIRSFTRDQATSCSTTETGRAAGVIDAAVGVKHVQQPKPGARHVVVHRFKLVLSVVLVLSVQAALFAWPSAVHASTGALSAGALEAFRQWLQYVDSLGNWGPVLFIGTVVVAEMVPLLPTQPVSLASGLLFGPVKGALFILVGVTLAAINAFLLSRGVGNTFAKNVIAAEAGEGHAASGGMLQSKLAEVRKAIASGSFMQQFVAVILLRLTPVVPYSASNYLLGLTPLQLPPFILGTAVGMTVWSLLYASLGGASRALLTSGASFNVMFSELAERAGGYTQNIALAAVGAGVVMAVYWIVRSSYKDKPKLDAPTASQEEDEAEAAEVEYVRQGVSSRK